MFTARPPKITLLLIDTLLPTVPFELALKICVDSFKLQESSYSILDTQDHARLIAQELVNVLSETPVQMEDDVPDISPPMTKEQLVGEIYRSLPFQIHAAIVRKLAFSALEMQPAGTVFVIIHRRAEALSFCDHPAFTITKPLPSQIQLVEILPHPTDVDSTFFPCLRHQLIVDPTISIETLSQVVTEKISI